MKYETFDRYVPRKPRPLGRVQWAQYKKNYLSGKLRPLGREDSLIKYTRSFIALPSRKRVVFVFCHCERERGNDITTQPRSGIVKE